MKPRDNLDEIGAGRSSLLRAAVVFTIVLLVAPLFVWVLVR